MASHSPLHDYIAGALGGAAGLVVGHPFDTIKVQQQVRQTSSPYKGVWDALKNVNREGLVRGYFRGLAFPLTSYGVVNSIFFGAYGNTLRRLCRGRGKPTYTDIWVAGCVAGAAQLVIACPADVVKVVMQAQIPKPGEAAANNGKNYYTTARQCIFAILREHGVRGLYRGVRLMGVRDIPAFGLYMLTYEYLYIHIDESRYSDRQGVMASLIGGGFAGILSWLVVHPFDVVKTIYQADQGQSGRNLLQHIKLIYDTRGVKGFFTGVTMSCIRAFPVNAVTFLVYAQTMKLLPTLSGSNIL